MMGDISSIKGKRVVDVIEESDGFDLIMDDSSILHAGACRYEADRPEPNSIYFHVIRPSESILKVRED